jgi:hypothetical protein
LNFQGQFLKDKKEEKSWNETSEELERRHCKNKGR